MHIDSIFVAEYSTNLKSLKSYKIRTINMTVTFEGLNSRTDGLFVTIYLVYMIPIHASGA